MINAGLLEDSFLGKAQTAAVAYNQRRSIALHILRKAPGHGL